MVTPFKLDRFKPRDYQLDFVKAFDGMQYNRYMVIWPRRAGKDVCMFSMLIRQALKKVANYAYILPNFTICRRVIWNMLDNDGKRLIDYYAPAEIVKSRNEQLMIIRLVNGSSIQMIGAQDADSAIVGTNFAGMIFSEFSWANPEVWKMALPILRGNSGFAVFISTVRGKNHFYDLYNVAKESSNWFCQYLTIDDTKHIDIKDIEEDIEQGHMSRDLAMQEYWNSWEMGVESSYYGKYLDFLRRKDQVTKVTWEPYLPVHTAWDLGYNDPTCIIFFQIANNQVRIIDSYKNNQKGLEHYAKIIKDKPYSYGKHIAPFDIGVHDLGTGVSRWKMMHDLGITFIRYSDKAPSIDDGIEEVRRVMPRMWIDEDSCKDLLKSIENYKEAKDNKNNIHKGRPIHDNFSHWADALRYLCVSLPKVQSGSSPEALENRYNEVMYGSGSNLPSFFK